MDSPFLGMVQYFAFGWAPKGYALCNGAQISISQNQALFALLGTQYGGNGTTTFALPDLQGRSIIGQSNSLTMGEKFGTPTATLLTTNMPMHTHSVAAIPVPSCTNTGRGGGPTLTDPTGHVYSNLLSGGGALYNSAPTPGANLGAPSVTVGVAGQSVPFSTQNPYLAVTATIATVGLFPSRN